MTSRVGSLLAVAVVGLGLGLTACSVSQDEVDEAFAGVEGLAGTSVSCGKVCDVTATMTPDATASMVADAVAAASGLDVASVLIEVPRGGPGDAGSTQTAVRATLEDVDALGDGAEGLAAPLGTALVALRERTDVDSASVEAGRVVWVEVRAGAGSEAWGVAEELWPVVAAVPGADLRVDGAAPYDEPGARSVTVGEEFPREAVAAARHLERMLGDAGLTGLAIRDGELWVGVLGAALPERVRREVARAPDVGDLAAPHVYLTRNVHEIAGAPFPVPDHTALLGRLQARPDVALALQTRTSLEISLVGRDLAGAADLYRELVTDTSPSGPGDTQVEVRPEAWAPPAGGGGEPGEVLVQLAPGSDPALLDLAHRVLVAGARVSSLELSTRGDRPHLGVEVRAPALAPELARMASVVAEWVAAAQPDGPVAERLGVGVSAVDREGRSPGTGWEVDLTSDPPGVVEVHGTEEAAEELRAAWARGVDTASPGR